MTLKSLIRTIPHYPRQGIMFRDITTLLKDPVGFKLMVGDLVRRDSGVPIDKVAGVESRGCRLPSFRARGGRISPPSCTLWNFRCIS